VIVPVIFIDFYKKGDGQVMPKAKRSLFIAGILIVLGLISYLVKVNWLGTLFMLFAIIGLMNLLFLAKLSRWVQEVGLVWLEEEYKKFLRFVLSKHHAIILIGLTFLLMIGTMVFYFGSNPKVEFFPSSDPKLINVLVEMPISTDVEVTDSVMQIFQEKVFEILKPHMDIVESVLTTTGKGAIGQNEGFTGRGGGPNKGIVTINFVDFEDRGGYSTLNIKNQLEEAFVNLYPGITVSIEKQRQGPPTGKPINLEISGKDFDALLSLTDTIRSVINAENIPGIEGLKIDLDVGKPELMIHIDRDKARRFGLSTGQIGDAIRTSVFGKEISDYKEGEDEYKIRM
jgi:multidrug efflux pump subunit AcrB